MKKTIVLLLVLLLLCVTGLSLNAAAGTWPYVLDSGYCGGEGDGTSLTWKLESDGTLTVSGEGPMADYTYSPFEGFLSPWYGDSRIEKVVISPGVTTVGELAFIQCEAMEQLDLPASLTRVDSSSFYNCSALKDIFFSGSEAQWEDTVSYGEPLYVVSFSDEAFRAAGVHFDVFAHGYCGYGKVKDLTWELTNSGVLTISGSTYMLVHPQSEVSENIANTPWKPYRDHIRKLVLEEGVLSISYAAFRDCTALTEVSLPGSLTLIASRTFKGCTSLTTVNIAEGCKSIVLEMFAGCVSLERITLPDSIRYISADAFDGCVSLAGITLPAHLISIGAEAFRNCNSLTDVELPESLTVIGESAFRKCANLKSIAVPAGITKIENFTFRDCVGLTEVLLPSGLTAIGEYVFSGCTALKDIAIPDTVREIRFYTFSGCTALETVHLPAGLRYIANSLFSDCGKLKNVNIPENVEGIYERAFKNCASLNEIRISATAKDIRPLAFWGMTSLQAFEIDAENPDYTVDEYGCLCSKDKTVLVCYPAGRDATAFTVPAYITVIKKDAFVGAETLEEVTFSASVTDIARGAFFSCPNIVSFTVDPENPVFCSVNNCVIEPASQALVLACKTSEIPDDGSVKNIRNRAFVNTGSSITVPGFIEEFESEVFAGCDMLETAVIAPGITKTGYSMFPATVKSVVIPDTVTFIEAFLIPRVNYENLSQCSDFEIWYTGSEEQWNAIHIENWYEALPNSNLLEAPKHFGYRFTEVDGTPSTCAVSGYTEGLFCDVTGTWVSGHKALPLLDHTPGEPVIENVTPGTCTEAGGYDKVIYCANCPAELSRRHVETAATGHVWGEWQVIKQATVSEEGLMRRTCANDPSHVEEEIIPKLQPQSSVFQRFIERIREFFQNMIDWFSKLFRF